MDLKENFAKNLVKFRRALGITQSELAEKLNYSDKAVSKRERAESVSDIDVIEQIADLFGVKIDVLISEPKPHKQTILNISKRRAVICLISAALVWLVAIIGYTTMNLIIPSFNKTWLFFVYAVPVTLVVLLCLTSVWGKNLCNAIFISLLLWTIILSVYLSLSYFLIFIPENLWMIWLIGLPLQGLIIFVFAYKKLK